MPTMFILVFGGAIFVTLLALAWAYTASARANSVRDDSEPVAIATGSEGDVSIMAGKLQNAGIKALTLNRTTSVYPTASGWELLVRYGDQQAARRILNLD
jgi:hypothetical protein